MKINKKALLLGTMAFVLVAASGMVRASASGSSGTKKAKVQTITEGVCIGSVDVGGMTKEAVSYTHLDVYKRQHLRCKRQRKQNNRSRSP